MKSLSVILGMAFSMILLASDSNVFADNDICVHLNGGEDVAYIGEYNTLEIWVANDIDIKTLQFTLEVCWTSGDVDWFWDMGYGSNPPFDRHGDAVDHLILFASDLTFDNLSCETFAAGGAAFMSSQNLPPGASRLCYSLQFGLLAGSPVVSEIQVQPYAYFSGFNWFFQRTDDSRLAPDFCGTPVSSINDPYAAPVSFDVVYRSQPTCGDVNCDGVVNISDSVWIINYVFIGGNEPCDTDGSGEPDC